MKEDVLKDYFTEKINVVELISDLENSSNEGKTISRYYIEDMTEDFEVKPIHLVKLCDLVINGLIKPEKLKDIAFCLMSSDHFFWSVESVSGEKVAEILQQWSVPENNYPLTSSNIEQSKIYLQNV